MTTPAVESVALAQALEKLQCLKINRDPHLFAKMNTEQATALLDERAELLAVVEGFRKYRNEATPASLHEWNALRARAAAALEASR